MQKPTDRVRRPTDTARPRRASAIARFNQRTVRLTRSAQAWLQAHADASVGSFVAATRSTLRPFTTPERALPVGVAALVAVASLLAVMPSTPAGAVGGVTGGGEDVRLAVGGGYSASTAQTAISLHRAAMALDDIPSFATLPGAKTTD